MTVISRAWTKLVYKNSNNSNLNIQSFDLGEAAIKGEADGDASELLATNMSTIATVSFNQVWTLTIELQRDSILVDRYQDRIKSDTLVGAVSLYSDVDSVSTLDLTNCIIKKIGAFGGDGKSAAFTLIMQGNLAINLDYV